MCFEKRNAEIAALCKERDELKRALQETKSELDKVKMERDALEKIVGKSGDGCVYCKNIEKMDACEDMAGCGVCLQEKECVCGTCNGGSNFSYRGLEGK